MLKSHDQHKSEVSLHTVSASSSSDPLAHKRILSSGKRLAHLYQLSPPPKSPFDGSLPPLRSLVPLEYLDGSAKHGVRSPLPDDYNKRQRQLVSESILSVRTMVKQDTKDLGKNGEEPERHERSHLCSPSDFDVRRRSSLIDDTSDSMRSEQRSTTLHSLTINNSDKNCLEDVSE